MSTTENSKPEPIIKGQDDATEKAQNHNKYRHNKQIKVQSVHEKVNEHLNKNLETHMPHRGLFKAVVRQIPTFLSKEEFYLGLNVNLPVTDWYFVHGGSQTPSASALGQESGTSGTPNYFSYSLQEGITYSIAYFGFDDETTMNSFIRKYDNFVVEVDQKRKYVLQVTRALYQTMPVYKEELPKAAKIACEKSKHEIE